MRIITATVTFCALHTTAALSVLNGSHVSKNYSQKNAFTFLLRHRRSRAPILRASVSNTRTLSFSASWVFWGREVHI